jgi:hypothetical protein
MSLAGRTLLAGLIAGGCALVNVGAATAMGSTSDAVEEREAKVFTDGRLRPGHLETIRVAGFPGKGVTEVSFFPTAICEDGCGANSIRGGRTNASGAAKFRVRVPGSFFDLRNRRSYFRDGERIAVNVTWTGSDQNFAAGSASPEPALIRTHGAGSAVASGSARSQAAAKKPLPVPGSFLLAGSNGYEIMVAASPARKGSVGVVSIMVAGKNEGVIYTAPATVTETSIQADLGVLGEISVAFQRSGVAAAARCGRDKFSFDSGRYVGTIEFHGEEGYTDVVATSVPGSIDYWLAAICGETVGGGSYGNARPPGAELYVRNPALGPEMSVSKSRPGAAAQISVVVLEYDNGIGIRRFTSRRIPAGGFVFDRHLRSATVRPPAPFSGVASFDRGKKAGQRWSGDLTVDMPGRADVPLIGSALRATLVPSE